MRAASKLAAGRISGARKRRDCWLLSLAIRRQRSMRLRAAAAKPPPLRAASKGRMRSTPSSVSFSIIHSKRSNLINAAAAATRTGASGDSTASIRRNRTRSPRASAISANQAFRLSVISYRWPGSARRTRARWRASSPRSSASPPRIASTKNLRRAIFNFAPRVSFRLLSPDSSSYYRAVIALLRGTLLEKHPNQAIVEAGGVGYDVAIPVSTFTRLPDSGAEVRQRIYTHVREDALSLYGFLTQDEKALFEKLIGVSGIGPTLAVKILSGLAAPDLIAAIRRGEADRLVRIPGVGKKTADRMVLELRDKLPGVTGEEPEAPAGTLSAIDQDVLSALLNLGCARPQAEAAVRKAKTPEIASNFEALFRRALELVR